MRTPRLPALLAAVLLSAAAGCDSAVPTSPAGATLAPLADGRTGSAGADGLAAARRATAAYHRVERAVDDGWVEFTPCIDGEEGGMGYHYVNVNLLDGDLDPAAPEALLYEPTSNGRLRLVAVEYIVPYDESDGPPSLFGQVFHPGPPGWTLHAWVWKNNPAGMFADWNPNVSCEHA